jgi:hypothetical protein
MIFEFLYAGGRVQNASEQFVLCIHLYLVKLRSSFNPTNKKIEFGVEIETATSQ